MPRLRAFREMIEEAVPAVDWIIEGLIVKGDRVLVYGEPGAMKSWILLHLGLHLAAGHPWLGTFNTAQVKSVLYVDEEMSERTLHRRICRLASGASLGNENLKFMSISGTNFRFETGRDLLQECNAQQFNPDVVIVETLRSVMVGDENSAQDVRNVWRSLEPLRQQGKTVIISHHMRKPQLRQTNARYRASGSTDLIGGPDTALAVERVGNRCMAKVTHIKCRNAEEHNPFTIHLRDRGQGQDCPVILVPGDSHDTASVVMGANVQLANQIREHLASLPERRATTSQIKQHFGDQAVTADRVDKALRCLRHDPQINHSHRGLWALRELPEDAVSISPINPESPSPIRRAVAATLSAAAHEDHRGSESSREEASTARASDA